MPFVYRYLRPTGVVVYVGKTKNLNQRHNQHKRDGWYDDDLDLQYIRVDTETEADMLETYFVGIYANSGMCNENIGKRWFGFEGSKFITIRDDEWINYEGECPIVMPESKKLNFQTTKTGDWAYIFICPCEEEFKYREYSKRNQYFDNFDFGQFRFRKINKVTAQYIECYHNWRYRRDTGKEIFWGGDEFNGLVATAYSTMIDAVKREKDYLSQTYGTDRYYEWLTKSYDFKSQLKKIIMETVDRDEICPEIYLSETPYPYLSEAAEYMEDLCR